MKLEAIDKVEAKSYTFRHLFLRNNSGHIIANGFTETDWRVRNLFEAIAGIPGKPSGTKKTRREGPGLGFIRQVTSR